MIIIDTNIIIDFLNDKQNEKVDIFYKLLQNKDDIGINTLPTPLSTLNIRFSVRF